jgi:hypothetical protein
MSRIYRKTLITSTVLSDEGQLNSRGCYEPERRWCQASVRRLGHVRTYVIHEPDR